MICRYKTLSSAVISKTVSDFWIGKLPPSLQPVEIGKDGFFYSAGKKLAAVPVSDPEGFALQIDPDGIRIDACDRSGLCYGLLQLSVLLDSEPDGLSCTLIQDKPVVKNRALMLDISRGKVYNRKYLLWLVNLLAALRFNVLQLYTEHTFDFTSYPEIAEGCGPITADDILAVKKACNERCISLQANLQSLGHCRHILKLRQFRDLRESDMFWSLCTTDEKVFEFLNRLYGEYLPLFDDPIVNVCLDEPYDLGADASITSGKTKPELYLGYLENIRKIAARYGKRLMVFGDVFAHNPDLANAIPEDVILLDWCYDPKPEYGTPEILAKTGKKFWICPGTGNWNTLFPRLDGAVMNIDRFLKEGLSSGADGMMLTDWNDHGGYTQPAPVYYIYAYAALASWKGKPVSASETAKCVDLVLKMPGYAEIILRLSKIYQLPPIWSKNRSECVMALFDEPVKGQTVCGPLPPPELRAYDLNLPEGIDHVYERHSMHPLRPCFAIPEDTIIHIKEIICSVIPEIDLLPDSFIRDELKYIASAFSLLTDKLEFSHALLKQFAEKNLNIEQILDLEMDAEGLVKRFTRAELSFVKLWLDIANTSEIEIPMSYFAHIIERLDYLRDWLSIQRENIQKGKCPDYEFLSYDTAGYTTLPTY